MRVAVALLLVALVGWWVYTRPLPSAIDAGAAPWPAYSPAEERDYCERQGLLGGFCGLTLEAIYCPPACDLYQRALDAERAGLVRRMR